MGEDGKAVDFKPPGFLGLSQCIIEKALFVFRYQNHAELKNRLGRPVRQAFPAILSWGQSSFSSPLLVVPF